MEAIWTVLIYVAADNDLTEIAADILAMVARTPTSESLRVAVQIDYRSSGTKRYVIADGRANEDPSIRSGVNLNSGASGTLRDFLDWGYAKFPSRWGCVQVFNHGGGVAEAPKVPRAPGVPSTRRRAYRPLARRLAVSGVLPEERIAFDVSADDYLDNGEFRQAIADSTRRTVDVLACHACLMGMLEIAYEMRDVTSFLVASETLVHERAWPYERILADLAADPAAHTPDVLSQRIVKVFGDRGADDFGSLSAYRTKLVPDLAQAFDAFAAELRRVASPAVVLLARTKSMNQLANPRYVDLLSMLLALELAFPDDEKLISASADVRRAFEGVLVANAALGAEHKDKCGMSVYFPVDRGARDDLPAYRTLQWVQSFPHWIQFLETILPPRERTDVPVPPDGSSFPGARERRAVVPRAAARERNAH